MDLNFSGNMFEYMSELIFKIPFHIHAHMKNIYKIYISVGQGGGDSVLKIKESIIRGG